jgi:hypothetical protein
MPIISAIKLLSQSDYVESAGQPGEAQYYGAGMFVSRKMTSD